MIENKSDDVVRWDFYRLMRKWRIDLYRIGERLIFDIVIPEPGFYLLRKYIELMKIQEQIDKGLVFDLTPEDIVGGKEDPALEGKDYVSPEKLDNYYLKLASDYGVELPEPPKAMRKTFVDVLEDYLPDGENPKVGVRTIEIEFPEGYKIDEVEVLSPSMSGYEGGPVYVNKEHQEVDKKIVFKAYFDKNMEAIKEKERNKHSWFWFYYIGKNAKFKESKERPHLVLDVKATPRDEVWNNWKMECFERIKEAARQQWLQELEGLENKRDRLLAELTGKDALKLRQIEKEEIMKVVLRWLLGPDFEFFPEELIEIGKNEWTLPYYEGIHEELMIEPISGSEIIKTRDVSPGEAMRIRGDIRKKMLKYLNTVRFIQQAIEWENVNWILYPYFWTVPDRWDFKQSLEHPDFYHEAFLRAGCARVVLTVRPGFEEAFVRFMETGEVDGEIEEDHPYLSLAEEIEASAKTVYKYTPNPNRGEYVFCWDDIPDVDEKRLKEHIDDMRNVILRDLPKEEANIWHRDRSWMEALKNAEIKKEEKKKENEGNEEVVIESKIIINMKSSNKVLVLIFELDPQNKTIRSIRQAGTQTGNVLALREEKILPVRYYISLEKEEEATKKYKRYVFFVPGEHIDTWYEYTPTGALHVEKGEEPSMW
ncbi:MAG TPA: hypothetical protein ENG50_01555 [Candidatus Altiarchaeales archaeon]|nr:hypothetical protein [Candidatus Altiarchaeales archaeon]